MRKVLLFLPLILFIQVDLSAQCANNTTITGSTSLVSGQGTGSAANPYRPGSIVRVTVEINGTYSHSGSNYWHGVQINLGSNFTFADDIDFYRTSFSGNDLKWKWSWGHTGSGPGAAGPGVYFDDNNDGNLGNNWGHSTNNPRGIFSFNIKVGNNATTTATITANILPDGFSGSYNSSSCDNDRLASNAKIIFNNIALPATLLSIRAEKANTKDIIVNWQTATEQNVSHFEIQYSSDGQTWSTLGRVQAAGQSTTVKNYSYTHIDPQSGENLYRIRVVDNDNREEFSRVVSVKKDYKGEFALQKPYPNPVKDKVKVRLISPEEGQGELALYTTTGILIKKIQVEMVRGLNEYALATDNLNSGIYLIRFTHETTTLSEKILKQAD